MSQEYSVPVYWHRIKWQKFSVPFKCLHSFEGSLQWGTDKKWTVSVINIKGEKKISVFLHGDSLWGPGCGTKGNVVALVK